MSANSVFLFILVVSVAASLAFHVAAVKWGLKWAHVAEISVLKSFGVLLLIQISAGIFAAIVITGLQLATPSLPEEFEIIIDVAIVLLAAIFLIALLFKAPIRQAARACLPYLLVSLTGLALAFAIRAYCYQGFRIPTNSMAPTLLGDHWQAPCSNCGAPSFCSPIDTRFFPPQDGVLFVCSNELKSVYIDRPTPQSGEGDRILTSKFLEPKRWDLIVFHLPSDPSQVYVKRLVGVPGERLTIRDGAVWVNDNRLEPPDSIRNIRYSPTINSYGHEHSGPGSEPVELGHDEYFVLGDFVDGANDSRMWQEGAPGHPPYAVPKENIVGVVINIYWPPARWTSFR